MDNIKRALQRTTDTKDCVIGAGAVSRSAEVFLRMFAGHKAIVVADTNTWEVAGRRVFELFDAAGIEQEEAFIFDAEHLYAEWSYVEQLRERLGATEAVAVAVGSGVINDLCKYVSSLFSRKYMCVGTAASMDGFTAYGASITKDGNKQTFSCPAPYAFVMDSLIAARAPKELAASGYADLIAKIPAGADWILADCVGAEKIDPFVWDLVQSDLKSSLDSPKAIFRGNVKKTEGLCKGLLMSGFAMQAMQSSRPASGTEHQFSHFWDMEGLSYPDGHHVSHGFKVGIGTLVSTAALEYLLERGVAVDVEDCVRRWPSWEAMEADIRILCEGRPGHLARCMEESAAKYPSQEELRSQILALQQNWSRVSSEIRKQILSLREIRSSLRDVGAPYEPEMICVSREHLKETLDFIPYMRSRFTAMDVLYRLGYLEDFKRSLFGKGGIWEI